MSAATAPIFANYDLQIGQRSQWQLGPLTLWILREPNEFKLTWLHDSDVFSIARNYQKNYSEAPPRHAERFRCSWIDSSTQLGLKPIAPDRPVVVRAREPLTVLPGDEVSFYVGTQLGVRVQAGAEPRTIAEIPSYRLSDTWFGPSLREGELCYASKTRARARLAEVPLRPTRALSRIKLVNQAGDPLLFQRLKLPITLLKLYQAHEGRFWTQGITVERTREGKEVECSIEPSAPEEAGIVEEVAPARHQERNVFKRTLGALFG